MVMSAVYTRHMHGSSTVISSTTSTVVSTSLGTSTTSAALPSLVLFGFSFRAFSFSQKALLLP